MPLSTGGPLNFTAIKTARIGSVGAGETILLQLWLPANLLKNDGDQLHIVSSIILAANANSKANNIYFNGTTITGRIATDNGLGRLDEAWVTRLSAGNVQAYGLTFNGPTATVVNIVRDAIATDLLAPVEVKLTGTGVADNDIVSRFLRVAYIPAAYLVNQ